MTPAEHIAQAEQLISMAMGAAGGPPADEVANVYLAAVAHGLIAVAVELGVPHDSHTAMVPDVG